MPRFGETRGGVGGGGEGERKKISVLMVCSGQERIRRGCSRNLFEETFQFLGLFFMSGTIANFSDIDTVIENRPDDRGRSTKEGEGFIMQPCDHLKSCMVSVCNCKLRD